MKKLIAKFLLAVCVLCFAADVMGATQNGTVRWSGPSSAEVGETFYVDASVYVTITGGWLLMDVSRPSGLETFERMSATGQYKCVASSSGNITFYAECTYQGRTYTGTKTIIVEPAPLQSVSIALSPSTAEPGDSVKCSLTAYSSAGDYIHGGSESWTLSSITNDAISSSGVVAVAPAQVTRDITVTGSYTYNGITKSDSKTIKVTRVPIALESITISSPTNSVVPGSAIPLSVVANSVYDGPIITGEASWRVVSKGFGDEVSSSGVVSIAPTNVSRTVQVTCDYSYDGITKSDTVELCVQRIWHKPTISPEDMTVVGDSQSVLLSCEDSDAEIHYTTDGSEPTAESPVYQKRFRVSGKTTVKAISIYEGGNVSEVAVAHYALGQCPDPVIVSAGGETFLQKGNQVALDWECADGVLRYTTDGSDVTEASSEYVGAFTIDETTTIKAKAFGETYFDSPQVEMMIRYLMHTITFDSCGGSEIPSVALQEELAYGDLPVPTREGCVFLGWYTESGGGERIANDTLVDVDRTLYARWCGIADVRVFSGRPWQEIVIGYTRMPLT